MSSSTRLLPRLVESVKCLTNNHVLSCKPKLMEHFLQDHKLLSIPMPECPTVARIGGERSYMLLGSAARLEQALMKWTMNELISKYKFNPVLVPNIVYDDIINKCGFPTRSSRSQVYKISGNNKDSILDEKERLANSNLMQPCIAGTSEFALVALHIGDTIPADDLPMRFCALSRCYRAETSRTSSEWGLYRVHYFNKVEMVALTMPDDSDRMHEEFLAIQKDIFSQLELNFKILDMPKDDLGLSATKKYDIEAWMPGRERYGEISSNSNCRDYQSSRLNIRYSKMVDRNGQLQLDSNFLHTVNGTACSSIRTMIALIEQHQTVDGQVKIPKPLVPFMNGDDVIPTNKDKELTKLLNLYPSQDERN